MDRWGVLFNYRVINIKDKIREITADIANMRTRQSEASEYIIKLSLLLLLFIGTGLALSFSISYSFSLLQGRNIGTDGIGSNFNVLSLFLKQLIAVILGVVGIAYFLRTPTKKIHTLGYIFALIAAIAMVYTEFAGPEINGSRRWLIIGGVSLQTGDFARLALILYLSNIFTQYHKALMHQVDVSYTTLLTRKLLVRFFIATFIYLGSLYLQKDYSSFMISIAVILALVLVSDLALWIKLSGLLGSSAVFSIIVLNDPNRMTRIMNFLNPGIDPLGVEFQVQKSYEIISNGGWIGNGIGNNMLEILRLPYFNNDFVFSIIIGEYGLLGGLTILFFFWLLCWYAYKVGKSLYHINRYYYYLLLAGTINIIVSVVAHVAVTIGIVPTAGLNLPFYSSGGSSMITTLWSYGLILRATVAWLHYEKNNNKVDLGTSGNTVQDNTTVSDKEPVHA